MKNNNKSKKEKVGKKIDKPAKKTITKKVSKINKKIKGFTLIELLAVIIILGILMIIAIPSVTSYISDSRKSSYVDTARQVIAGVRNIVNDGKLGMYDTNTTYYIPVDYVPTENALKSPYGEFTQAYVGVVYNGTGYKYYWISVDDAGQGIDEITSVDKLDTNLIKSDLKADDIENTVHTKGIGSRTDIKIYNTNSNSWDPYSVSNVNDNVPEDGGESTPSTPAQTVTCQWVSGAGQWSLNSSAIQQGAISQSELPECTQEINGTTKKVHDCGAGQKACVNQSNNAYRCKSGSSCPSQYPNPAFSVKTTTCTCQ